MTRICFFRGDCKEVWVYVAFPFKASDKKIFVIREATFYLFLSQSPAWLVLLVQAHWQLRTIVWVGSLCPFWVHTRGFQGVSVPLFLLFLANIILYRNTIPVFKPLLKKKTYKFCDKKLHLIYCSIHNTFSKQFLFLFLHGPEYRY